MKQVLSILGIIALALGLSSAISISETPQDPPRGKKAKKHIKMVKVDDEGNKSEIDTVLDADEVFIWNGDTIDGGKELKWAMDGDFDFDFETDFDVKQSGNGNVAIIKRGKGENAKVYEFKTHEGDSVKHIRMKVMADGEDILKWHDKDVNEMIFTTPHLGHAPNVFNIKKHNKNVIDLSDPGIISYDKKEMKNGREKITIIREKPDENEDMHEEIIIRGNHSAPMIWNEKATGNKTKRIKVIAGDDGHVEILEDGKVWNIEEGDGDVQVIEEDGKKIIIKKTKSGDEVNVEVEVEEKKEEK